MKLTHVVVGLESTGCYGASLLHYLKQKGVKLVLVNTAHTKKVKEVGDNSPGKTDKKGPRVIADIIELGRWLTVVIPEGTATELRRLIHAPDRYLTQRTSLLYQLHDLVFVIFPEWEHQLNNLNAKTAQYLVYHYPTPEQIVELGLEKLAAIVRRISRGKITFEWAQHVYEAAQQSIGIKQGRTSIIKDIRDIVPLIDKYNSYIRAREAEISRELAKIPYGQNILSIKGIGEITVAGLIGECADFSDFPVFAEVERFAGLNLYEISSGQRKGQKRISKRGRPLLRKLVYFAALNVVREGCAFHDTYQRYLKQGLAKMKALIAIMRKLLRVIFALVRDHSEFDENYLVNKQLSTAA